MIRIANHTIVAVSYCLDELVGVERLELGLEIAAVFVVYEKQSDLIRTEGVLQHRLDQGLEHRLVEVLQEVYRVLEHVLSLQEK